MVSGLGGDGVGNHDSDVIPDGAPVTSSWAPAIKKVNTNCNIDNDNDNGTQIMDI